MTAPADERELSSTERGFLLYAYLLERPRKTAEVQELLGYGSYSAAASLLYRMRAAGLVRDDDMYWFVGETALEMSHRA